VIHKAFTIRHRFADGVYLDPYCRKAYPKPDEDQLWRPREFVNMPSDSPRVYWTPENANADLNHYAQRPQDWVVVAIKVIEGEE